MGRLPTLSWVLPALSNGVWWWNTRIDTAIQNLPKGFNCLTCQVRKRARVVYQRLCCCGNVVATRAVCMWSGVVLLEHKAVPANKCYNSNCIQNFVTVANPCHVTWNHDQSGNMQIFHPKSWHLTVPAISLDHSSIWIMFSRIAPNTCSPMISWETDLEPGFAREKNLRPMADGPITIIASPLQTTTSSVIHEHQGKVWPTTTKPRGPLSPAKVLFSVCNSKRSAHWTITVQQMVTCH